MSEPKRIPAQVFCLAEMISDEMFERGWRTEDVAIRMGGKDVHEIGIDLLTLDLLMCVQDDRMNIGDDIFERLSRAFDVSAQYFRNLHEMWLAHPDRRAPFSPHDTLFGKISRSAIRRPRARKDQP